MSKKNTVYIEILNKRNVNEVLRALQFTNSRDKRALSKIVSAPIKRMQYGSKVNLTKQKSVITSNLLNSFKNKTTIGRDFYYSRFGSTSKYVYAIDLGTEDRYTASGKWTGAVGRATTDYKGRNYAFKLGFATRAVQSELPTLPSKLNKDVERVVDNILTRNKRT